MSGDVQGVGRAVFPAAAAEVPFTTTTSQPALYAELLSLQVSLWFEIDHRGGHEAHRFFTPDAQLRFMDARFTGSEQIAQVYANRSARGDRVSRHLVTNLQLVTVQPARVSAISGLILFADDGIAPLPSTTPAMVGDVHDELELINGRWLISSRWIRYLFIDATTELAVPSK